MTKTTSVLILGILLLANPAAAQTCGAIPNPPLNGQTTSASQLMADFEAVRTCVNAIPFILRGPQGRLTLTSGVPVMTSDVVGATTIYYSPYAGNYIPISINGTTFTPFTFPELSATTTAAAQLAGGLYDLFVFQVSGVPVLAFGPAWQSATVRGTGTGTTNVVMYDGILVNGNSTTLNNGVTTYNVVGRRSTYVGTVAITSTAGQMTMQFQPTPVAGGNGTWLGVWNAYNRVNVRATSTDSTASWTYGSPTMRASNNSNSNRISWVDGMRQSQIVARFDQVTGNTSSGAKGALGWDSTTTAATGAVTATSQNSNGSSIIRNSFSRDANILLGFHYVQALESAVSSTPTFYGSTTYGKANTLEVKLGM